MSENEHFIIDFTNERAVPISQGESILHASLEAGIPLFHVCGGNARCSTCRVLILDGHNHLSSPNKIEMALQKKMRFPAHVRLACQTYVQGSPVKLNRIIKDEADIDLYIEEGHADACSQLGDEKDMALLFLDILGFTPFIEKYPPFDVIHIIRKLFASFHNIIEANGGRIVETAGDGLYAAFDFNNQIYKAASSAVESGYSMLADLAIMNNTYFSRFFDHSIEIGIGVHVGKVVSGNIKLGANKHTIVMGYPVNIASRLQTMTRKLNNNFIISNEVMRHTSLDAQSYKATTVQLKGIQGMIDVYCIGQEFSSQ